MWASLLVAAGLLAACGSSEAAEGGGVEAVVTPTTTAVRASTSTTVAETTTSRALTEEEVVVQTVAAAWDMLVRTSQPPDPTSPELATYLTGAQLDRAVQVLEDRQAKGVEVKVPDGSIARHRLKVESIDGAVATVADCETDDLWIVKSATHEVVDSQVVNRLWTIRAERVDGTWKVADMVLEENWYSGDPGCVADW